MIKKFTVNSCSKKTDLKDFDPEDIAGLLKEEVKQDYIELKERFAKVQDVFYASKKYSLLIVLQGMDCSGKDGTVKKALTGINPCGFKVESFKVPTFEELQHDYLWRIHRKTAVRGEIRVFNRSYYEDVLVTRVHKTIDDDTAFLRFKEIKNFEKYLVDNNTIILKFFLHISKEFQKEKLEKRLQDPEKFWKFSEADIKERKFWDMYQEYYSDVISNCSTKEAPWYIIPANHRWFRDYIILKVIVNALENLDLEYPPMEGNIEHLIQEVKNCDL